LPDIPFIAFMYDSILAGDDCCWLSFHGCKNLMFVKGITDRALKKVKPRKATYLFGERLFFSGKKLYVLLLTLLLVHRDFYKKIL